LNIYFDFDGTLIDSKLRLYKLFQHLVCDSNLTYDQYWSFKQRKVSNQVILSSQFGYPDSKIRVFIDNWMMLIEHEDFLIFDKPIIGVADTLKTLKESATLYVCTARQFSEPVMLQLEQFDLLKYFRKIMVTHQKYSKDELINNYVPEYCKSDWFIGDTGHDIQIGKKLHLNTCAVTSGFLSRQVLMEYDPDRILNSVTEFSL